MANNRVQRGQVITYSNTGAAIAAGDVVEIGNCIGVALVDIAATTGVGEVAISEVWNLPKKDAAVIGLGETVMWDTSTGDVDDNAAIPAVGDISNFGVAFEAKGATTGETIAVLLTPGVGTVA